MPAHVSIGTVSIGSASHNTGLFIGQNMQNNWDSHSPVVGARGGIFGNYSLSVTQYSYLLNEALIGQPIGDQDFKSNHSPLWVGP